MRRSKRVKSMARVWRAVATISRRLWRAAPWVLLGAILLALGVLGLSSLRGRMPGWLPWTALAAAAVAPVLALRLDPPHRPTPGPAATLTVFAGAVAAVGHVASNLIAARVNSFYSASLLGEGALLMYALHAAQAGMRRISPPPDSAAPRAADAFVDGVRVLLMTFLVTTWANLLPFAAVAFLLGLGFAVIAVVLRAPGALAQLAPPR